MTNLHETSHEVWKDIIGLEGQYQISNTGKMKLLARYVNAKKGSKRPIPEVILKPFLDASGYFHYTLKKKDKSYHYKTHRAIAEYFIPNPENKLFVNHINGIKTDNRIENLEWCTPRENNVHAFKMGLAKGKRGSSNHQSKLNEAIVIHIWNNPNLDANELANVYQVGRHAIQSIFRGDTWNHVTGLPKRKRDENRRLVV
jgi:hypothetical protein